MAEKPKSGGRWGDLVALGIGAGAIAYFARGGSDRFTGATFNDWWETLIVIIPTLAALAAITYLIIRVWDLITERVRRR